MDSVYQLTFFLSLVLLAIVITVFVLAVSLLGRAVKLSVQEQIRAEERRKQDTQNEIKKMVGKLKKAKAKGRIDIGDLTKSLKDLQNRDSRHKWKLRWIRIKPKLLTANGGALIPGALFLIAVIFSGLALDQPSETATASLYMWISLIALGIGICFVCLTLKVIQGVAITSEETAFMREVEVFKTGLRAFEEEKEPKLALEFLSEEPPLHIEPSEEKELEVGLKLTHGLIARNPEVFFMAPKGFDFPDKNTWFQSEDRKALAGNITASVGFRNCRPELVYIGTINIKAPEEKGIYNLWYYIKCEDFDSGYHKFEAVVDTPS